MLDTLMEANLPQMELYYEIGRTVSNQQEKGAAVAAAEHLQSAFPEASGFSPRNLRRMRDFSLAYENNPVLLAQAMTLGWTQNVVLLESDLTVSERTWYINAAQQSSWTKLELLREIEGGAHLEESLDLTEGVCYTEEDNPVEEAAAHVTDRDPQCGGVGSSGPCARSERPFL